jgi:hypothetical protein
MISWWPGDGNAEDIIGGNDGTLQGGVTFLPGMVPPAAFTFDGTTGAVNIPNNGGNLNLGVSDFTIDAWVRFTGSLVAGETAVIFQYYGGDPEYQLLIDENNHLSFSFRDNNLNIVEVSGTTLLNDGLWHFVVGVREGTTGRIYVDSNIPESSATNPSVGSVDITCLAAHIGGSNTSPGNCTSLLANAAFFTGQIDEVEVFRRALTPTEIFNIYNAGSAGKCKPCLSGTVTYCPNPNLPPVDGVTLTLTGTSGGSTISDGTGYYEFSLPPLVFGGSYVVTPTKAALLPTTGNIDTVDAIVTKNQFCFLPTCIPLPLPPLSECQLAAADVNGDGVVDDADKDAIQDFYLGTTATPNVGQYKFTPASRTYTPLITCQTGQNYDALIFGDVAKKFVHN